ncbi:hypothetical protein [Crassaminicella profunda]|uniref:hypothetical protein n=1 Tax=Crassaminicella profunda TaxID=1286698 RepID=UPI001CA652E3|nr:hypothetical protein [Crassaminicella profunda]QZY56220.1 hypothetical protein K7H06_04325 [Crassaminicella profunda]
MFKKQKILTLTIFILFLLSTSYVFAHYENTYHPHKKNTLSDEELAFWGINININNEKNQPATPTNINKEDYLFWGRPLNIK